MAKMTGVRPMLDVDSIEETRRFYEEVLGFTTIGTWGADPGKPTWLQVQRDEVRLMFTHSEPHTHDDGSVHAHEPALGGALYIDVDDVDAVYEELKGRTPKFEWLPADQAHGMREFGVVDNNGFLLVFGMPVGE